MAEPKKDIMLPAAPSPPRRPAPPAEKIAEEEGKVPPLFIRVDKYKEVIQNLQRLKSYSLSLRDALDALNDIEKELKTGIELIQKALDDFNAIISLLDAKLIRLTVGEEEGAEIEAPEHMEMYIKGVYEQIQKIRDDLRAISA